MASTVRSNLLNNSASIYVSTKVLYQKNPPSSSVPTKQSKSNLSNVRIRKRSLTLLLNVRGLYRNDDLFDSSNQPWYAMYINTMMSVICHQFLFTMFILKLQTNFIICASCAYISTNTNSYLLHRRPMIYSSACTYTWYIICVRHLEHHLSRHVYILLRSTRKMWQLWVPSSRYCYLLLPISAMLYSCVGFVPWYQ